MKASRINRFLQICLDIAEYYDTKCEENDFCFNDDLIKDLGLGCKALSGYMRNGAKEVIELQANYHTRKELLHSANECIEQVKQILPLLDPDMDSKEAIQKIRDILSE